MADLSNENPEPGRLKAEFVLMDWSDEVEVVVQDDRGDGESLEDRGIGFVEIQEHE